MTSPITVAPRRDYQTFLDFPFANDLDTLHADVAIMGTPYGDPYSIDEMTNDQTNAPTAIRRESVRTSDSLDRYDFDFGGTLFDGKDIKVVDVGDVPGTVRDLSGHYARAEAATRKIVGKGALLITMGGDHGIPIPLMRGLEEIGETITLVQVDAHIDWRDDLNGVREGYSSPIRRASEMDHIGDIYQLGIRAQGSARPEEVDAALAYGSNIVTAYEIHSNGMQSVIDRIPEGGHFYLTIDADGLDPSVMPAVAGPAPGGLLFPQVRELIHGLVNRGKLVGMDINEITPSRDVNSITSHTAGRLMLNLIGSAVRAGYFD